MFFPKIIQQNFPEFLDCMYFSYLRKFYSLRSTENSTLKSGPPCRSVWYHVPATGTYTTISVRHFNFATMPKGAKIFIGNLPMDVREQEIEVSKNPPPTLLLRMLADNRSHATALQRLFDKYGRIRDIDIKTPGRPPAVRTVAACAAVELSSLVCPLRSSRLFITKTSATLRMRCTGATATSSTAIGCASN